MSKLFALIGIVVFAVIFIITALAGVTLSLINIFLYVNQGSVILLCIIFIVLCVRIFNR